MGTRRNRRITAAVPTEDLIGVPFPMQGGREARELWYLTQALGIYQGAITKDDPRLALTALKELRTIDKESREAEPRQVEEIGNLLPAPRVHGKDTE